MRRIYDSPALNRSDDDPYRPNESDAKEKPRASRTLPSGTLSDLLVPIWVRNRGVSVSISTPEAVYGLGVPVPIQITMHNALPFPVTIPTRSPVLWNWAVDGYPEASRVAASRTADGGRFRFDRGEYKEFTRVWDQRFRVSDSQWESCTPGEFVISAEINVDNSERNGLSDQTTVRIE